MDSEVGFPPYINDAVPSNKVFGVFKPSLVFFYSYPWCIHRVADVQWECKASLPSDVTFSEIEVTCEGYEYPEDPYVSS